MGAASKPDDRDPDEGPGGRTEDRPQHGQRHERCHQQVRQRRDDRETPEVQQDERQRGQLGGQRDAQCLRQPARGARGRQSAHGGFCRAAQGQQPGRRCQRELQADVVHHARICQQQTHAGDAQRCCRARRTPTLARQEHHAAHDGGSDHAGLRAGHDRVAADGDQDDEAAGPAPQPGRAQQPRGDAGHERDVPAADGHDMGESGRGEVIRHRAPHALAQPDQDARCEPRLRLRDGASDGLVDGPAEPFDRGHGTWSCREPLDSVCLERAYGAPPGEEAGEARGIFWRCIQRAPQRQPVTGHQGGVPWKPGIDEPAAGRLTLGGASQGQLQEGPLLIAGRRRDVDHLGRPRAAPCRQGQSRGRWCGDEADPGAQGNGPETQQEGRDSHVAPRQCRDSADQHPRADDHDQERRQARVEPPATREQGGGDGAQGQPGGTRQDRHDQPPGALWVTRRPAPGPRCRRTRPARRCPGRADRRRT